MARDTWYRLDNVGKFYSSQAGSSFQTVFRYSATLVDDVDADVLQRAVEKAVRVFPSFNVCLRSGMFWHYLEPANTPPSVSLENLPICFGLHVDTKSVLFRVSYYRSRINFEISHMVSDGRGALNFFKALLYTYAQEQYGIEDLALEHDGSVHQKTENSFDKYYERNKAAPTLAEHKKTNSMHSSKIYRLSGWRDVADPTYMEYHLPTQSVRDLARSYGVSVTALVIAAIICAIRAEMPLRERHRTIRITIPVDLRQIFGSTTTNNFFGLAFVSYQPRGDEPVCEAAQHVQAQLKIAAQAEHLKPRMNRMIALEKNPVLRFAPLFMKDFALELANFVSTRETTTTVSNLGRIQLDERLLPFFRDINVLTSTTGTNFTLCTLENDLSIGISTIYSNLDVIKHFCRFFSTQGIKGLLHINKTSEEVAADWRETKLETSVKRLGGQVSPHNESSSNPRNPLKQNGLNDETV